MPTVHNDDHIFANISGTGLTFQSLSLNNAVSIINHAGSTPFGYSITGLAAAGSERRTLSATETTAANIAAFVATLASDLRKHGLLP